MIQGYKEIIELIKDVKVKVTGIDKRLMYIEIKFEDWEEHKEESKIIRDITKLNEKSIENLGDKTNILFKLNKEKVNGIKKDVKWGVERVLSIIGLVLSVTGLIAIIGTAVISFLNFMGS